MAHVYRDAVPDTLAAFGLICDVEPSRKCKVDSLCNIIASVEARVVTRSSRDHELTRSLNRSPQLYTLAEQTIRVNKCGFVSDKLRAKSRLIREETMNIFLKEFVRAEVDAIPELGLAQVQVVDGVEVHVLFVPAEHGFPGSHVDVRRSHTI